VTSISSPSYEGRSVISQPENSRRWDPGETNPEETNPGNSGEVKPNRHLAVLVSTAMISAAIDNEDDDGCSRTDLDSHANMVVVGRHALIVSTSGKTAEVSPFTPDYEALQKVPIVDAAIAYTCPCTNKEYILIVRDALSVPSMKNNLIPPFIMREAGLHVETTPKIQATDPTIEHHSIYFPHDDFRIPLSLSGVFSYFPTTKPSIRSLNDCDEVFLLTPDCNWNPHSDAFARNEENMLDWEGNMVEKKDRRKILLSEIEIDSTMVAPAEICKLEASFIDHRVEEMQAVVEDNKDLRPEWKPVPLEADEVASVLCSVSPLLDQNSMY
jgi:hypothetical protein